ncbi:MAG: hypothetical protein HY735_29170 [Verrucomicrobia bacterium]|nr:hypothetical protein [Verrucomicrobiota bacterium]
MPTAFAYSPENHPTLDRAVDSCGRASGGDERFEPPARVAAGRHRVTDSPSPHE